MLNITANLGYKKSNINFGTNLIIGQGVVDHLNKHPEELKTIQDFKNYLAEDGKNWNAELTYDKFEPKEIPLDETEKLIKKYAQSYDYKAREHAEENISQTKNFQKTADFLEKLTQDPDYRVANEAAGLAGYIKDSKIAIALIEKLIQSSNSEIKESAVFAISNIEDEKLRDVEIEKLLNSNDIIIKRSAVSVLYKMKDSKNYDLLFAKLYNDKDPEIRGYALCAIADFDDDEYNKKAELYDSIIESALKDSESQVRNAAFSSIGKLTDPKKATAFIEEALSSDADGWEKARAAESAGYIKDSRLAKDMILKLLDNPDSDVRRGAAGAVAHIKDEAVQNELMEKILDSKEVNIRSEAVWALNDIKDVKKVVFYEEKLLKDQEPEIREKAAGTFGYLNDEKTGINLISNHINDSDVSIKKGIINSVDDLSRFGSDKDAAKEFAQILAKDEDKYIQKEANNILNKIKRDSQKDHYNLKITDGCKVLGQKQVTENRYGDKNIFDSLFNAYKAIFEKSV